MHRNLLFVLLVAGIGLLAGCLGGGESLDPTSTPSQAPADGNATEVNASQEASPSRTANGSDTPSDATAEGSTPSPDGNAGTSTEGDASTDATVAYELAYGGLDGSIEKVIPIEGTFGPNETCVPAGCARSSLGEDPFHHDIPLDPHIPPGVPVRITGTLQYDQGTAGDVHPNMRTGDAQLYGARITNTEGPTDIDFRLASPHEDPVVLEVGGHAPDGPEGTSYSGTLTVAADPGIVPAGVPTAVPVPEDAEAIELAPADGDRVGFTLWDPSGERVTRTTADELPARVDVTNGSAGDYALQVEAPASGARVDLVAEEGPQGTLEPLETVPVFGSAQPAVPGRAVSGSFEAAAPPVAVGVYERSAQPVMSRTGEDPTLEITAPSGTVMDRSAGQQAAFDTPAWVGGGFEDRYLTPPATSGLAPGTYEFQVTDHRDAGAEFGGFALLWAGVADSG